MLVAAAANAQTAAFRWIRQIGGSGNESLAGVATDRLGNTYVAGTTTSLDFPVVNAVQPRPAGSGIFRIDGPGTNWRNLYQAGVIAGFGLLLDPQNSRTVYTATGGAILRSTDAGDTWQTIANPDAGISGFAIAADGAVYVAAGKRGILKSTDGGASFMAANTGLPLVADSQPYGFRIWADPSHAAVVFAVVGTSTAYTLARSGDAGATWQLIQNAVVPGVGTVTFDPIVSGKVYVTGENRSAVSVNDGVTWMALGKLGSVSLQPSIIAADPLHPGVLYGAGPDSLWKSVDGGATWTRKIAGATPALAFDNSTGVGYAVQGSHVIMSADGFDTTTTIGPPSVYATVLAAGGGRVFVGAQASSDAFVAKLDRDGNTVWATYIGGSSTDVAQAMAVDSSGAVYVTGTTQSGDFPATTGAYATSGTSFVLKLSADGSLVWSTYFGGQPNAIAVDGAGHAYVGGQATIGNMIVTTPGAYQTKFQGTFCGLGCLISFPPFNGFLTEFDSAGASLVFSTYFGDQNESAKAVALLPDASVAAAGERGLYRFDAMGSSLLALKNVPGRIQSLTPDGAGGLLVTGSNEFGTGAANFPATPGVVQPAPHPSAYGSSSDGFVIRMDSQLNVVTATLLGGESSDIALSAATAADGSVIVGGSTYSKAFPTVGELQSDFSGQTGFLSQLTPDFSALLFSTYMGDARNFYVASVAATPDGGMVFGGTTSPPPALVVGPFGNPTLGVNSGFQAFVVRVDPVRPAGPRIDSVVNAASQLAVPLSQREAIQVRGVGFGDDAGVLLNGVAVPLLAHDTKTLTLQVPADFNTGSATLEVGSQGGVADVAVPGAQAAPGIYYVLNKDGTRNSASNPAMEGDEITIFATGVGPMTFDHGYAVTDTPPVVSVDGFYANGIAAVLGPVGGLPGDVYQISVYVPRPSDYADQNPNLKGFVMPPQVPVMLTIGGVSSQYGVTLYMTH